MNFQQAAPIRRALTDITNITPLTFNSSIKRTRSEPPPAAPVIPVISPQSPLNTLGRAAIITLRADSQPNNVIAAKLNTTPRTVRRWVKRFENIPSLYDKYRTGRPSKVCQEIKIIICLTAREEKFITPRGIRAMLDLRDISSRTIRRILDQAGLFSQQWWFQQDNDPKHTSKVVQEWIRQSGIDVIDWPPYSPDLNPIENLWADVKRRAEDSNPQNLEQLKTALREAWDTTDPVLIEKLIKSMRKRCKLVVGNNGWMTGY